MNRIKKIIAGLLLACMLFAFAACGSDTPEAIVGEWSAAGVVIGGKVVPLLLNDKASSLYLGRNFTAGKDGSFMLQSGSQAHVGKWKEEDKTVVRHTWSLKRKDTYGYSEDTKTKAPSEFTVWTGASEPDVLYFADTATGENITVVFVRKGDTGRFDPEAETEAETETDAAAEGTGTDTAAPSGDAAAPSGDAAAPSGDAAAPSAADTPASDAPAESGGNAGGGSILDSILGMIPGLDGLDLGGLLEGFDLGSIIDTIGGLFG